MASLFLTGATGYVGRRILRRAVLASLRVTVLVRDPARVDADLRDDSRVRVVVGDLLESSAYADAVEDGALVVHAAALTGKAGRARHMAVNADGTRALVEVAARAGVSRFLHVSTIAVKFADRPHYHYAAAKEVAEGIVRSAALPWTIVRPTMVAGPGSPVVDGLARLALLPLVPVFGDGRPRVQPVFVEDLAAILLDAVSAPELAGETFDVGGPEALSIEALMRRIRELRGAGPARVVHVPLRPVRGVLGALEPLLLPLLPLTAGQLATFANDGTAEPHPFVEARHGDLRSLDAMLEPASRE